MKIIFYFLAFVIFMTGCQSGSSDGDRTMSMDSKGMAPSMEEGQSPEGGSMDDIAVSDQKIIRNGNISIEVDDALKAKAAVDALLEKHRAYTGNEQFDNTDYSSNYHIQIRVPAENLNALVADLESLDGLVTYKSITASDVTEEYVDLETRLINKRSYLEQYRQLLKNARTIEDILKVREQIRVLEEEIESVEGRLKYLKNQVALSTLDLTLIQKKDFVYRPDRRINFWERLKDAFSTGWYGFVQFGFVIVGLWPFWLLLAIIIWLIRRYKNKRLSK